MHTHTHNNYHIESLGWGRGSLSQISVRTLLCFPGGPAWFYKNLLPVCSCVLTYAYFFWLDLMSLPQLCLNLWHLKLLYLVFVSSHSIWKSCWWPQTVHLDYTPCLLLSCCHGIVRLQARHVSLESQYLCFVTSWGRVCACQTFTVFKVLPVRLLIWTVAGLPQLALWQFPILSRQERRPALPVPAFGKSNVMLPANSLACLQGSTAVFSNSSFQVKHSLNIYFKRRLFLLLTLTSSSLFPSLIFLHRMHRRYAKKCIYISRKEELLKL